ncbi:hypothetical protein PCE1_004177 [Barthelona sp. PCE]
MSDVDEGENFRVIRERDGVYNDWSTKQYFLGIFFLTVIVISCFFAFRAIFKAKIPGVEYTNGDFLGIARVPRIQNYSSSMVDWIYITHSSDVFTDLHERVIWKYSVLYPMSTIVVLFHNFDILNGWDLPPNVLVKQANITESLEGYYGGRMFLSQVYLYEKAPHWSNHITKLCALHFAHMTGGCVGDTEVLPISENACSETSLYIGETNVSPFLTHYQQDSYQLNTFFNVLENNYEVEIYLAIEKILGHIHHNAPHKERLRSGNRVFDAGIMGYKYTPLTQYLYETIQNRCIAIKVTGQKNAIVEQGSLLDIILS